MRLGAKDAAKGKALLQQNIGSGKGPPTSLRRRCGCSCRRGGWRGLHAEREAPSSRSEATLGLRVSRRVTKGELTGLSSPQPVWGRLKA